MHFLLHWAFFVSVSILSSERSFLSDCLRDCIHLICSCYCTVPSAKWEIFSKFFIFCNLFIRAKYEKRGKYSPTLHEATCDNYFIVECLIKSNLSRVIAFAFNAKSFAIAFPVFFGFFFVFFLLVTFSGRAVKSFFSRRLMISYQESVWSRSDSFLGPTKKSFRNNNKLFFNLLFVTRVAHDTAYAR